MKNPETILRIDASMRHEGSVTRDLTDLLIAARPDAKVVVRDLASDPLPQIDADWIAANFTDPAERSAAQADMLALSDTLVAELRAADEIIIGVPIYNFGVPAALKAWVDLVARARETFRYTETGPVGLLDGKRATLVLASGGTGLGSEIDFVTPWLRHVLGFIGISDVSIIAADRLIADPSRLDTARAEAGRTALAA